MTANEPITILSREVDQHPAALAWKRLHGGRPPQAIEVLQKQSKTEIYRLLAGMPGGEPIIAKYCLTPIGKVERVIYEEVLPCLPVSQLNYYGCLQEDDSYMWLFLADAGKTPLSIEDEAHRVLGAHWLGQLHRSARQTRAAQVLPERNFPFYLELMQKTREIIVENLANPILKAADSDILRNVLTQFDALESNWSSLLRLCEDIPTTLVHRDFRPKNVFIKQTSTGDTLYALDWEMAGWGNPLVDLAAAPGVTPEPQVDPPTYISIMQEIWPHVDEASLRYLVHVGYIFRRLDAIHWSSLKLSPLWVEGPIQNMDIYHKELSHAWGIVVAGET